MDALDDQAGDRLRRFVDERMATRGITSVIALADTADVGRDTLYAWFRGREPTPRTGGRVARALGVSYRELLDVFEGNTETPPPSDLTALLAGMDRQTAAIEAQVEAITALAGLLAPLVGEQAESVRSNSELLGRLLEQVLQADARLSALERTRE